MPNHVKSIGRPNEIVAIPNPGLTPTVFKVANAAKSFSVWPATIFDSNAKRTFLPKRRHPSLHCFEARKATTNESYFFPSNRQFLGQNVSLACCTNQPFHLSSLQCFLQLPLCPPPSFPTRPLPIMMNFRFGVYLP